MLIPYPILFRPILKARVWGGRRLARLGKALPPGDAAIGESWEVADLPAEIDGGRSIIANGALAGRSLRDAISHLQEDIIGSTSLTPEGGFPLLIKYLDARENLSVQVHPTEEYASSHPGSFVKSEAWVVLEAVPGSVIYQGLVDDLSPERLRRDIATGDIVDDLVAMPARVGDCHYLPSGTCHALGAGVLVAEVQTPSDTTFRLYDWGRVGRALHVEEALACIDFSGHSELQSRSLRVAPIVAGEFITEVLCRTEFFSIEQIAAKAGSDLPVVTQSRPVVWMILSGDGAVRTAGAETVAFSTGSTMLMPAAIDQAVAQFHRETKMLRVVLPSSSGKLIA